MHRFVFIFLLISVFVLKNAQAQNRTSVDVGAEIGFPSGNFTNLSAIGLGTSVKGSFPLADRFAFSANAGIMNFFGKRTLGLRIQDLTYASLKGGLKYYFSDAFYLEGQVGTALSLKDGQGSLFVWAPGIGNQFKLSGANRLDFGIRYESWNGNSNNQIILNNSAAKGFVGIRFSYVFGL